MKFWKKFLVLLFALITTVALYIFENDVCKLDLTIDDLHISANLYVVISCLISLWIVCHIAKSFLFWFVSLFFKKRTSADIASINEIAKLIISDNYELKNNIEKVSVAEHFKVLITALILKSDINTKKYIEKTGIPSIDIHIIKLKLKDSLEEYNVSKSIDIIENAIKRYSKYIDIIKYEILEVAKLATSQGLHFKFDPRKFKYNLPQSFVDTYYTELSFINIEKAIDTNDKLKLIEKLYKSYPDNKIVIEKYLKILQETNVSNCNDKKISDTIKKSIVTIQDRKYAHILLALDKRDAFETAQEITKNISDNNLEKLWFLLIIATNLRFLQKAKELIEKIIETDTSDEIFKFFVKNYSILGNSTEIIEILDNKNEYKI